MLLLNVPVKDSNRLERSRVSNVTISKGVNRVNVKLGFVLGGIP